MSPVSQSQSTAGRMFWTGHSIGPVRPASFTGEPVTLRMEVASWVNNCTSVTHLCTARALTRSCVTSAPTPVPTSSTRTHLPRHACFNLLRKAKANERNPQQCVDQAHARGRRHARHLHRICCRKLPCTGSCSGLCQTRLTLKCLGTATSWPVVRVLHSRAQNVRDARCNE